MGIRIMTRILIGILVLNGALRLSTQRTIQYPNTMPIGQPKMESAILARGLRTGFIKLRAAIKLRGMARKVPNVVANRARKTVSTIFFHVSYAVRVKWGVPTFWRRVARMY